MNQVSSTDDVGLVVGFGAFNAEGDENSAQKLEAYKSLTFMSNIDVSDKIEHPSTLIGIRQ